MFNLALHYYWKAYTMHYSYALSETPHSTTQDSTILSPRQRFTCGFKQLTRMLLRGINRKLQKCRDAFVRLEYGTLATHFF